MPSILCHVVQTWTSYLKDTKRRNIENEWVRLTRVVSIGDTFFSAILFEYRYRREFFLAMYRFQYRRYFLTLNMGDTFTDTFYEYLHAWQTKARPHQINRPITMFDSYRNLPAKVLYAYPWSLKFTSFITNQLFISCHCRDVFIDWHSMFTVQ